MPRKGHTIQHDERGDRASTYFVWIRRNGKSRYFNLGPNRKKAEEKLREIERDVENGRILFSVLDPGTTQSVNGAGARDMRIEELAHRHLGWVEGNRSAGTLVNRRAYVLQFLDFAGEAMVSQVSRSTVEGFYAWAKARGRSENPGNEALAAVKAMFRWGEEQELIDIPFRRFPKMSHIPPALRRIEPDDLRVLLAVADGDFRDMLVFGLLTGLRPIELRELRQGQVHHTPEGSYVLIERHKTSRSARVPTPRSVPLSPEAERIVERRFKAHPRSEHVFLHPDGVPFTRYTFRDMLRRLSRKAGLAKSVTPYALRHTFASMESEQGTETTSLARLMGHTTTRTLQRYVLNTFKHHKEAVDVLDRRLEGVLKAGGKWEAAGAVAAPAGRAEAGSPAAGK